jgi:hypothetical protein
MKISRLPSHWIPVHFWCLLWVDIHRVALFLGCGNLSICTYLLIWCWSVCTLTKAYFVPSHVCTGLQQDVITSLWHVSLIYLNMAIMLYSVHSLDIYFLRITLQKLAQLNPLDRASSSPATEHQFLRSPAESDSFRTPIRLMMETDPRFETLYISNIPDTAYNAKHSVRIVTILSDCRRGLDR